MAKKSSPVTPKVYAMLDTNCIHANTEARLISTPFAEMIETTGPQLGLDIRWYVPNVVVGERRRQMNEHAQNMQPTLERASQLLGRNLISGPEELSINVDRVIAEDIARLGIREVELDVDRVAWREIIDSAVERLPPFEPEKPDKGFKDALILETFKQLIGTLPVTTKAARIFLVTNDGLLGEAAKQVSEGFQNVVIVTRENLEADLPLSQRTLHKPTLKL